MSRITFIIGGARSGKSAFALKEASAFKGKKAFIATAETIDEEMRQRIENHRKQRGEDWITYEEPLKIADLVEDIKGKYSVILIDCLTLWLSNLLIRTQNTEHRTQTIEMELENFLNTIKSFQNSSVCALASDFCSLFIVSNEVGMGIVPGNDLARKFRDIAGFLNQKIAEIADEVYVVVAGIPIGVK